MRPSRRPTVAILRAPGTNRHTDMEFAFERAGAESAHVPLVDLPERAATVRDAPIIAIAGGFSFADALGSGRVFADELVRRLGDLLAEKVSRGHVVIGICNGFQVLVRSGLLPGGGAAPAALARNSRGSFECRWVTLGTVPSRCVWTSGIDAVAAPVAHGEGRFTADDATLRALDANEQVALRYVDATTAPAGGAHPHNPNGSARDIAGICDATGLVLGMMPHPENNVTARQGFSGALPALAGSGLGIFENGVRHARSC